MDGYVQGAVNGTRTRDPRLGKPMLYQLSYYRNVTKMVDKKDIIAFQEEEPIPGLEPGTYALRMRCSTN